MKFSKASFFLAILTASICDSVTAVVIDTIPQFTKTINNEIVCEKVVEQHQLLQKTDDIKDGVIGKSRFVCVVAPEYTPTGEAYGIKLSMNDVDESFRSAFTAAKKTGHTELWIKNPLVEGSSVKLPSTSNERGSSTTTAFSGSLFHKEVIEVVERIGGRALRSSAETIKSKMCFSPHMQWRKPKDTLTQKRRNLAVNQTGIRSVIVFRVKVGTSELTPSAAEISEEMFSTASNMITLVSQMKACSFNQLNFAHSTSSSFFFAADGVVEVTFASNILQNTDQATDIENAIKTLYGSAMNGVDHKVYAVVSILFYFD